MPCYPNSEPPWNAHRGPVVVVYKKVFDVMLHLEAEWPFEIYVNCRHNFVRTRTLAGFKVWGEQNAFLRGKIFVFVIYLIEIFLSTAKFRRYKKILGQLSPNPPPTLPTGLGRTDARKSSIWGLLLCAGGLGILNIYFQFTTWTTFAGFANSL